ncbi:hypothetical protein O9992_27795 [Vibrio lentus]|nr:hypothetical protein [Vibrio lentus]
MTPDENFNGDMDISLDIQMALTRFKLLPI